MKPSSSRLAALATGVALALIALPATVRSAETIVDNTGYPDHTGQELTASGMAAARAFEFATPVFRSLETIRIRVKNYNDPGSSTARVKFWSGAGTTPTDLLEDLGTVTFSGSGNEIMSINSTSFPLLQPNTRYWVSVHWVSGDFDWLVTNDTGNSAAALGTIQAAGVTSNNNGSSWNELTGPTDFHQFEVLGFASVVTSPADSGAGSLRDIIAGIPSGGPPITFDPSLSGGTITLTSGELVIDKDLTIDASALADGITISGDKTGDGRSADDSRIFRIAPGGHTVEMNSLTLRGGYGVHLAGAELDNGGGAILHPDGDLTLNRCTLAENFAQLGGAILHAAGSLTLNHTTIAGNETNDSLVGLGFYGGGGIFIAGGTVALNHCTLSTNVTTNTGGGLNLLGGTLTLTSTIVAGNTAGSSGDIDFQGGSLIASGVNLIGDHTTVEAEFPFALPLVGQPGNLALPLLAPLGDYGGPTHTMPPLPDSPTIDAAGATALPTDQRGAPRTVDGDAVAGAVADIGAVEYQPAVVTTPIDEDGIEPGDGLSLREAIARAHVSTITFAPGLSGQTITLGDSQILLDKDLTIDASALGAGIIVSGSANTAINQTHDFGESRIFEVAAGQTITLRKMQIIRGQVATEGGGDQSFGGAIFNRGNLTLDQCRVEDSHAQSGGGIRNDGSLTLVQTTLSGNSANGNGGGIMAVGSQAIVHSIHSTISGNNAAGNGGGISTISGPTLTFSQSTLANNTAGSNGGGLYVSSGTIANFTQSTLTANTATNGSGGGISNFGTVNLTGSILAGNLGSDYSSIPPNDNGDNFISGDPLLAPLGDYGGPTQTMPPLPGSPAIDAGGVAALTTDQRGAPRTVDGDAVAGAVADVGAVEYQPAVVTTHLDEDGVEPGAGLSLREAIARAHVSTITFDASLSGRTLTLGATQLTLDRSVIIDASALPAGFTIDANGGVTHHRVLEVQNGAVVTLDSLTLTGGVDEIQGGGIYNDRGSLTLNNATLFNNHVVGNQVDIDGVGGGIYNKGGSLTLNNATLCANSAAYSGGSICNDRGSLTLNNATLTANDAFFSGGIYTEEGSLLTLNNSIVAGNTAFGFPNVHGTINADNGHNLTSGDPLLAPLGDYGGPTQTMPPLPGSPAIDAGGATALPTDQRGAPRTVDGDAVAGAVADIGAVEYQPAVVTTHLDEDGVEPGAGLSLREAIARPHVSTITFAPGLSGQRLTLGATQLTLDRSVIIDASTLPAGFTIDANGAVTHHRVLQVQSGAVVTLDSLTLTGGVDSFAGGGIFNNGGDLTLTLTTLLNNHADGGSFGGGAIWNLGGILTLNHTTLSSNHADGSTFGGGAIHSQLGTLTLNHTTLFNNHADGSGFGGGAIHILGGTLTLNNATLSANHADGSSGGGIFNEVGNLTLTHTTVSANHADSGGGSGGGIYHQSGTLNLNRTIVAGNTASTSPNVRGTINSSASSLTDGDPLLAPLDFYGGTTLTMPPLPGSPAIDTGGTASPFATDQRGLPRVVDTGIFLEGPYADIGAVEIQGPAETLAILGPLWLSNTDGDTDAFGLEFAFGTDANVADFTSPRRFQITGTDGSGKPTLTFGFNPHAFPYTSWIVKRSTTLLPDSFTEIFRFDGPAMMMTPTGTTASIVGDIFHVVDDSPPPGGAFYLFEAEPGPPTP